MKRSVFYPIVICTVLQLLVMQASSQNLLLTATGTGRTTGHIANLNIKNTGKEATKVLVGPYFIPSDGKYQPYIVANIKPVTVPPGGTVQVSLEGYCTDISRPPVPAGGNMPSISEWIDPRQDIPGWSGGFPPGGNPLPANSIPPILIPPGTPGSSQDGSPAAFTVNQDKHPETAAPLLLAALNSITNTYDSLKNKSSISTPFSGNPEKERESVIQQTFWIYAGGLTGKDYNKEDFSQQLIEQYETNSGNDFDKAPEKVQTQVLDGAEDFWSAFQLVGAEAKVLSIPTGSSYETPPVPTEPINAPPPEKEGSDCEPFQKIICTPESCFDLNIMIADSWGDQEERDTIKAQLTMELSGSGKEKEGEYAIGKRPAAAYAFWEQNHVGGQAAVYAKTIFSKAEGGSEWVMWTDSVKAKAKGSKEYTLGFNEGEGCKSFVAGVSLARVKGTSFAFDAAAGNTEESIHVLRALYFLGDLAIDIIATKGKITGKKLLEILTDKAKDQLKEEAENMAKEEFEKLLGDKVRELAKEYGLDIDNVDFSKLEFPDFDISMEKIIPPGANTFAESEGSLQSTVGKQTATATARSAAFYIREGLEDKSETISGTGTICREVIVSDSKAHSLTATIAGTSSTRGQAHGNGFAEAALESMYALVMIGVCECPDGWTWEVLTDAGYYTKNSDKMGLVNLDFEDMVNHVGEQLKDEKFRNKEDVQKSLEAEMKKWAAAHPLIWDNCKTGQ